MLGGLNGLVTFAALCMASIILFPSPAEDRLKSQKEKDKQVSKSSKSISNKKSSLEHKKQK